MALFPIALVLATLLHNSSQQYDNVEIVSQELSYRNTNQMSQQISSFVTQEVTYKAYASYFGRADVSLPGIQHYLQSYASTARKQAIELTKLAIELGMHVRYSKIQLSQACAVVGKELRAGDITKPLAEQPGSARTKPLICQFLLLNRKDKPDKPDRSDKEKDKDKDKVKTRKIKPSKSRRGRSKRWAWSLPLFSSDQASPMNTIQREPLSEATRVNPLDSRTPVYTLGDRTAWQDGLFGLEDALAIEKKAQQELLTFLIETRRGSERDPRLYHALRFYLDQHVTSTYKVAELVKRLQRHQDLDTYELEEYLIDQELGDDDDDDD
ncbi:hypothetical protein RRG08_017919 [Elysia crispata]|uniref:ferroxidase n=1 Tax=Elysia crispata TaxID=231223 RepID=A0AAE1CPK9_9GAST|nr:hypothetical protein RRG08_017919 [Elysia crispata]